MSSIKKKKVYSSEFVEKRRRRVFVGMSGGVDSSVAALLLKHATPNNFEKLFGRPTPKGFRGYDVTGIFMKCFNLDGCAERDTEDARRVAEHLKIPFYVFDFEKEYKKRVVEYMINGYKMGITPNPDVMCNREIKFGMFLERALALGADYIATGHYVRLRNTKNTRKYEKETKPISYIRKKFVFRSLWQAKDKNKDQSYFLWTLTQDQLKHSLFPIGDYTKPEVREIARKAKLPTAEKKDSQGICFLGKVKLPDFLKEYIEPKKGDVLDTEGNKIGEHEGAQFYTIGQRHINVNFQFPNNKLQINSKNKNSKIGSKLSTMGGSAFGGKIKNSKNSDREPYYVVSKDVKKNIVVVAEGAENPELFRKEIEIINVHFINPQHSDILQNVGMSVMARVRYRQPLAPAILRKLNKDTYSLEFKNPQKFIAPGQSVVFYTKQSSAPSSMEDSVGKEMFGGGVII